MTLDFNSTTTDGSLCVVFNRLSTSKNCIGSPSGVGGGSIRGFSVTPFALKIYL